VNRRPLSSALFAAFFVLSSFWLLTGTSNAFEGRVFGLRFSETEYRLNPGSLAGQAGMVVSREASYVGTRARYAIWEDLVVYGETGILDAEDIDPGLSAQIGATYELPLSRPLPVDFALDATIAKPIMDGITAWNSRVSIITRYNMRDYVPGLLTFAGLGVSYTDADLSAGLDTDSNGIGIELDFGADYRITENISLNAGIGLLFGSGISDAAISIGMIYSPPLAK